MDTTMKEISNNNQPDVTSTEDCSEVLNDSIEEPNVPRSIISTNFSEKAFDTIIHLIKTENSSLFDEECSDSEDTVSIISKSVDTKDQNQPQESMWNVASTSGERYISISESNSQVLSNTELTKKLVDIFPMTRSGLPSEGKITNNCTTMCTSSTSTTIMKLSSKPTSHICLESCLLCNKPFRVLDNPYHISQIRSIDRQIEFLKIEPTLTIDSCLCDFCWKFLERSYKSNMAEKNNVDLSFLQKRAKLLERHPKKFSSKKKSLSKQCSMHYCSKSYTYKVSVEKYKTITQLLSKFEFYNFTFIPSRKTSPELLKFPFYLCDHDSAIILTLISCQMCGYDLQEPFNTDDWLMYKTWNLKLIFNKMPLLLQAGMFLCMTCKKNLSTGSGAFPAVELPFLLKYINLMKKLRLKVYGPPPNSLFNILQVSKYIAPPIVVPYKMKQERVRSEKKIMFSVPLITATFHYEYDDDENNIDTFITSTKFCIPKLEPIDEELNSIKLEEGNVQAYVANEDPNVSDIEMTNILIKSVDDIKSEYIPDQNVAIEDPYVSDIEMTNLLIKSVDDIKSEYISDQNVANEDPYVSDIEMANSLIKSVNDIKSEYIPDQNVANEDSYVSDIEITNSLIKSVDDIKSEYIPNQNVANEDPYVSDIEMTNSLIKSVDIKSEYIPDQNSSENVSEDNYFTDTVTNYVVTTNMDDYKDLLQSHIKNEMFKNEEIDQYPGIAGVNFLQYQVDNLKIEENESEIIDIYSHQVGSGHNEIENYQCEPEISDFNSQQQDVCNVVRYKNNMDLEEDNQCMNLINTINKTVYLNDSDNSMYSYSASVEPSKAIESLKRKRIISNKGVKKQRLNEINSSYDDSSIVDNTTSNINIAHPSTNASSILNMSFNCGNKHLLNSDCIDVQDLPSNVDEESVMPQSDSMNTNVPSNLIEQAFSLDLNYLSPLQFEQTSKKVTEFYNKENSSENVVKNVLLDKDTSDSESLSESIILSDSEIIVPNTGILSDFEEFSDTGSEISFNSLESKMIEDDYIRVLSNSDLDSNDEIVNFEIKPDQRIDIDSKFVPNNKNILNTNTTNRSNNSKELNWIIVDDVKMSEYVIESHGEVKPPSGDEKSQFITIIDNEEGFDNRKLSTCKIISDDEIKQSSGDDESQSMVISENENNVIDSIIISYDEIKLPSSDKKSQCMIISEEEFNNMEISDIISMSDSNNIVNSQALKPLSINNSRNKSCFFEFPCLQLTGDHSFNDVLPDELQEYFEDICEAIRLFFNDVEDQSLRTLYSKIGNETDMFLYLMENLRMLYNGELILSDTACPSAQNYYTEQMETLYNLYGDPKFNINASKPFIHPSSRLHQYSKRLSPTVEPLKITDITSTSTSVQNTSNVSYTSLKYTETGISVSKIKNKSTPYKAKQSFPLFNSRNIVSRSSKTCTTCTKPLLSNIIPYSPNDKSTLTPSVPHQTQIKVQLPFVVQKRKRDNTKVYYRPKFLAPPPPAIPIPNEMRSSIMQSKPPVLLQKHPYSINY